jgi:hypothetical protein
MRVLCIFYFIGALSASFAAPPPATVTAVQDKSCTLTIVGFDHYSLKSPQKKISVPAGHHTVLLRAAPTFYPTFSDVITVPAQQYDENSRYTIKGVFTPSTGRLSVVVTDETKQAHPK